MDEFEAELLDKEIEEAVEGEEAEYKLKYLGKEIEVDREKAIELAQKGMDYDRIRGRYERLKSSAKGVSEVKRSEDIEGFLEDYPEVEPGSIPEEVWREVQAGRGLSEAYTRWERTKVREEYEAFKQNQALGVRSTGSRDGGGEPETDEFVRELRR